MIPVIVKLCESHSRAGDLLIRNLRKYLGATLKDLALQKECTIEEGHLMSDHVHIGGSQIRRISMIPVIVKLCESPSRAGGLLISN
jgi:hypothetical protein